MSLSNHLKNRNNAQSINALSLAPNTRDWLANSHHPRILHIFDHACNLINERREVLSIVTSQIGPGPFNIVMEEDVFLSELLSPQSPISISPAQLTLGDLTISIDNAKLWLPRPDWEALHARRHDIPNQIMSLRERWSPPRSNPLVSWEIASSQKASALLATTLPITNYRSLISYLSCALANADISTAKEVTFQLAGLGAGLTPAGDDFIMGALYSVWIIHPLEVATILTKEIANTAAPLTTSLSGAWLRSAGRGEAGILWHRYFDALISANLLRSQEARDKILAVGETSGADAFAGFFGVFMYWADCVDKNLHPKAIQ